MQEQLANAKDGARLYFIRGTCIRSSPIRALRRGGGGAQVDRVVSAWCPSRRQSPIGCLLPSSRASPQRVRTLYRHIPRAWTMRCRGSRRLWIIPTSPHVMLPRPWHSPACRPRSCVGERRSMRRPRPGIEVPFRRLTTTDGRSGSRWFSLMVFFLLWMFIVRRTILDTRNGCRKSGSRLTEIGCPTQVCVCVCVYG